MNKNDEDVVTGVLDKLHDEVHPDLEEALQGFSVDAIYQSLVPARQPIVGRASIIAELGKQFDRYTECVCEIIAMASNDRFVFTERKDHVTMTNWNKRIFSSVNAVFEFNDDNQIVSWREFWDTGDIATQLGLSDDQMKALHGVTPSAD